MSNKFTRIGLMGKQGNPEVQSTFSHLVTFLKENKLDIIMDKACKQLMPDLKVESQSKEKLAKQCDLMIVVGGDGSLLEAARNCVDHNVPVVGVNRGRKGFLTDITPQALTQSLSPILSGEYIAENRFLLETKIIRNNKTADQGIALNDVVLYSGNIAKMIDFEVSVNNRFVQKQRSDGLICTTPTGSTAYALSGGGPILHPTLNAIALVPMHPHTLSSRPIVIDSSDKIELHLDAENILQPRLSCDGQEHFNILPDDKILIQRKAKQLCLIHPTDYDFYHTLRTKLGWSSNSPHQ